MSFIIGTIATALTFAIVAYFLPQIDFGGDVVSLLILAVIAGLINGLVKPILRIFALPLTIMTMGLFGIVINAVLLLALAWISGQVGLDFTVGGFPQDGISLAAVTSAVIGAIGISIVGAIVGTVVRD
jgi:putative membrane protein